VQDYHTALKFSEDADIHYIPKVLYKHRLHKNSVTSSKRVTQHVLSGLVLRRALKRRALIGDAIGTVDIPLGGVSDREVGQFLAFQRLGFRIRVRVVTMADIELIIPKIGLIDEIIVDGQPNGLLTEIQDTLKPLISEKFLFVRTSL
jgi:hypothetical protein